MRAPTGVLVQALRFNVSPTVGLMVVLRVGRASVKCVHLWVVPSLSELRDTAGRAERVGVRETLPFRRSEKGCHVLIFRHVFRLVNVRLTLVHEGV